MGLAGADVLAWSVGIAMAMLSIALLLCLYRVAIGPSLPDRVVALDLISIIIIGLFAVYAVNIEEPSLIDAAIVLALVAFLGTITFARFMERVARR